MAKHTFRQLLRTSAAALRRKRNVTAVYLLLRFAVVRGQRN